MKLPKPDNFRRYKITDGSIIYPSGGDFSRDGINVVMKDAGKWMLWVKDGEEPGPSGNMVAFGHFVMTRDSIKYYNTPYLALQELESIRNVV